MAAGSATGMSLVASASGNGEPSERLPNKPVRSKPSTGRALDLLARASEEHRPVVVAVRAG